MIAPFQTAYIPCINMSTRTNDSDALAHTQTHTLGHRDRNKHMRTNVHPQVSSHPHTAQW